MNQEIQNLTDLYFSAFKNKDINLLKNLYHQDVELVDWTGQWYGIESVVLSNENLFNNEYELIVMAINIVGLTSYNSIVIRFDDGPIEILDVLYFDESLKIKKIRAYKG